MGTPPLLQLLAVFVLGFASSRADNDITFPLPSYCPTSCSDITFEYPFGVGHGCFRPGFELTCVNNTTTNPPKLILGNESSIIEVVRNVDLGSLYNAPEIDVTAPFAITDGDVNSYSLTAPPPFLFSSESLMVVGCNVVGSVVDLTSNQTRGTCNTTCADEGAHLEDVYAFMYHSCNGTGCCEIGIEKEVKSYGIRLYRKNHTRTVNTSVVKVSFEMSWNINDHPSCKDAKGTKTYACLSESSNCADTDGFSGYLCHCPSSDTGNPYVPDGCDIDRPTLVPSPNCATRCGNLSVPFPFGLGKGCYRDVSFNLSCDETSRPPTLTFNSLAVVNISVDEGQIQITSSDGSGIMDWNLNMPAGSFYSMAEQAIFNWSINYKSCAQGKLDNGKFACRSSKSKCIDKEAVTGLVDQEKSSGYNCKCIDGFEGNPYLDGGCTDIDECKKPGLYPCFGDCNNIFGNYSCTCPAGMHGDPTKGSCLSHKKNNLLLSIIVGMGVGFGTMLLVLTSFFAKWKWKKESEKRIRQRHFRQNHGLLLQQFIASNEDDSKKTKIFSLEELEKATDNFDTSRIIGQGGHGTVYKGILSDLHIVAIKRSKIVVKREIDQFINEVIVLSQINHRNIVKLFGCCLETEVPLLVYEFISNGTLFYHLHNPDDMLRLSWRDRLRIATEAAGALVYLHSSASTSICHRDMKSSNILLDEYYTTKVSDFGTSRFIPLDQTRIFTAIQGTFGYLDPEYYQTSELTEKSDVYSFGVILLELLTGQKPIPSSQSEEGNLANQFLQALKENKQFQLMEAQVLKEGTKEELDEVAKLAQLCLMLKGSQRPTMREVELRLRYLRRLQDMPEQEILED